MRVHSSIEKASGWCDVIPSTNYDVIDLLIKVRLFPLVLL